MTCCYGLTSLEILLIIALAILIGVSLALSIFATQKKRSADILARMLHGTPVPRGTLNVIYGRRRDE